MTVVRLVDFVDEQLGLSIFRAGTFGFQVFRLRFDLFSICSSGFESLVLQFRSLGAVSFYVVSVVFQQCFRKACSTRLAVVVGLTLGLLGY